MKSAPFRYSAPASIAQATALLAELGDDGKVIAGGQSLVPMMNFRLVRPGHLVDINRIAELDYVRVEQSELRIGALARHVRFERALAPGPLGALLPSIARHIAHLPIRTRGTFVGSLAHADPAAEWCTVAVTLDAEITAESSSGRRTIPARELFRTLFTTALTPGELITEVRLPVLSDDWKAGFCEFSRRAGDYAIVLAVVAVRLSGERIAEARVGLGGVADRPIRAPGAEAALVGATAGADAFAAAGHAAAEGVEPLEDVQASAGYRRDLVRVMVRRALEGALRP